MLVYKNDPTEEGGGTIVSLYNVSCVFLILIKPHLFLVRFTKVIELINLKISGKHFKLSTSFNSIAGCLLYTAHGSIPLIY